MILKKLKEIYYNSVWRKKFHDFYFGIKPKKKPKTIVEIGGMYQLDYDDNPDPFKREKKASMPVEVTDIREGYVKYLWPGTLTRIEDSMKLKTFQIIYKRVK